MVVGRQLWSLLCVQVQLSGQSEATQQLTFDTTGSLKSLWYVAYTVADCMHSWVSPEQTLSLSMGKTSS